MGESDDNELARKTAAAGGGVLVTGAITLAAGSPTTAFGAAGLAVATTAATVVMTTVEEAYRRRNERNTLRWTKAFVGDDSLSPEEAARQVEARMAADPNAARCMVDSFRAMLTAVDDAAVPVLAMIAREQADLGGGPTRYTRNMFELVTALDFMDLGALRHLLSSALTRGRKHNDTIPIACAGRELLVFVPGHPVRPSVAASHEDPTGLLAALERSALVRDDSSTDFAHDGTYTLSRKGALFVPWAERMLLALSAAHAAAQ